MRTLTIRKQVAAAITPIMVLLMGVLFALSTPAWAQTLTATPQDILVPAGQTKGSAIITWDAAPKAKYAILWQQIDGGEETVVAAKTNGEQSVIVKVGETCVFKLYNLGKSKLLASITVTAHQREAAPDDAAPVLAVPTITVTPQTVLIPAGKKSGKTILTWDAGANPEAEVWLAVGNVVDEFFAAGAKGTQTVVVEAGKTYTFNLYKNKNAQDPLATVVVTVVDPN